MATIEVTYELLNAHEWANLGHLVDESMTAVVETAATEEALIADTLADQPKNPVTRRARLLESQTVDNLFRMLDEEKEPLGQSDELALVGIAHALLTGAHRNFLRRMGIGDAG